MLSMQLYLEMKILVLKLIPAVLNYAFTTSSLRSGLQVKVLVQDRRFSFAYLLQRNEGE